MNWFKGKNRKSAQCSVSSDQSNLTTDHLPLTTSRKSTPFRAGLLSIFLALFTSFLMIRTAAVISAPVSFSSGGAQTDWTTASSGATATLPIAANYATYDSKDSGIAAGTDIKLQSTGHTALQTSDACTQDSCTSTGCVMPAGFNAGTITPAGSLAVFSTGSAAKVASLAVSPSGLVGLWHLNDGGSSTTTVDASGNGNTGTLTIGATGTQTTVASAWTNGAGANAKLGNQALSFDESDDYVKIGGDDTFKTLTEGTVEGWFKANVLANQSIFSVGPKTTSSQGLNFEIAVLSSGVIRILQRNIDVATSTIQATGPTVSTGVWYHFVWVVDASGNKFYLDGALQTLSYTAGSATSPDFFDDIATTQNYWIAAKRYGGAIASFHDGLIDDVAIYNRALTQGEITARYNAGAGCEIGTCYLTSGSFESATMDLGAVTYGLDTLSWNATVPGTANGAGVTIPTATTGLLNLWNLENALTDAKGSNTLTNSAAAFDSITYKFGTYSLYFNANADKAYTGSS